MVRVTVALSVPLRHGFSSCRPQSTEEDEMTTTQLLWTNF